MPATAPVVRFAPSPTGRLHVGNARTALVNQLLARRDGGRVILRIDDTDLGRSRPEYEAAIREDLTWLEYGWALSVKQSERFDLYAAAAEKLKAGGFLYPCWETEEELDRKRKLQRARGLPPVYDRAALSLTDAQKAAYAAESRAPHWRFKLSGTRVDWTDLVRGPSHIETSSVSDPILVRADGSYLYTLPSCVDDIDLAITHVVRGEDHVTNSAAQIEIFRALGAEPPTMAHMPLLVGADGDKLSKRLGSLSIGDIREGGLEPMTLSSYLARLGTSQPIEPFADFDRLAASFDFAHMGRAPARFDEADLGRLNAGILQATPFEAVEGRLAQLGIGGGAAFWELARGNVTRLPEAADWWSVVNGPITPVIEDAAFTSAAAALVPDGPFDGSAWSSFTEAVKAQTGAKGKALFMPLRLALTGRNHGPEMAPLFALLGPEKARARLLGQAV